MSDKYVAVTPRLTEDIYNSLSSSFSLDLIALFDVIQEDVMKILTEGVKNKKTPDEIIQEVRDLI